jgi:hypothetical protein
LHPLGGRIILCFLFLFPSSSQIARMQWVMYGYTSLIYAALAIAYLIYGRRALSVVSDSALLSRRMSGRMRSYVRRFPSFIPAFFFTL